MLTLTDSEFKALYAILAVLLAVAIGGLAWSIARLVTSGKDSRHAKGTETIAN